MNRGTRACLCVLLAVAPVCSLRLLSSDPTPTLSWNEQDELDQALDKLDEEELMAYIKTFTPSRELASAWARASDTRDDTHEDGELKKSMVGIEAAIARCKSLVQHHLSYGNMQAIAEHGEYCVDPWFKTKNCSEPYMIPGYRLGDLLKSSSHYAPYLEAYIQKLFPDSIAAKFIRSDPKYRAKSKAKRYAQLYSVISGPDYANYERPAPSDLVVHVRAFDVLQMCGGVNRVWSENPTCDGYRTHMVRGHKYWQSVINSTDWTSVNRAILVTGDHMTVGQSSSPNSMTDEYLKRISQLITDQTGVPVTQRKNGNADCDFIYMAGAHPGNLIHTGGGFDTLIVNMVELGSKQ